MKMQKATKEINENSFLYHGDNKIINQRYKSCLEWYIRNACFYRGLYFILMVIIGICPLVSASLTALTENVYAKCAVILLSLAASGSTVLLNLFRSLDKWTEYRSSAEFLKRERMKFLHSIAGKDGSDKEKLETDFLNVIEEYMADENKKWKADNRKDKQDA